MENNSTSVNMEHLLESFLGDTPDLAEKTEANIPVSVNNFESNSNISNCLTKFMIDRLKSGRIGKEDVFKMLDASVCLGLHFVKAATNLSNSNHRKISALVFYMMEQYSHYLTRSELSNIVYYCQSRRSILSKLCNECREYVSDSTFADVVVSRFCNFIMERYPFYEIEEKGIFLTVIASIVSINSKSGLNVYGWFDNEQPRSAQSQITLKLKNLKPKSKSSINKDNENENDNNNDDDKNGKKNNSENEKDSQENKKENETTKESKDKDKDKSKDETDTAVVTTNKSENENDKMEDDWMDDESELFNFNERLYKAFWSVQDVLCNPELLCGKDKKVRDSIFLKFRNNLYYVLSEFSENGVSNEEAKVHFKTRQDESSDYQCKYLTSKKLFNLQLKDPSLRRQMLIQIMIFLKPHTIDVEATKLRNVKGKEEERQWFLEAYRIAGNQLSMIPPDGQRLASFVNQALKQESLWLSWKYTKKDKCRSLEKKGKKESKTNNDKNDTSNDSSHKSKLARKLVNSNDSNNDNDNDNNNSGNNNDEPPRKRQRQSKIPLMGSSQLAKLWQSRPECFNPNSINYDNCTQTRNRIRAANAHWNQNNDINVESAAPKNDKFYCGLMDFPRRRPLIVPTTQNKGMDWLARRIESRNDALETSLNKLKSAVKNNIEVNKNLRNALKNPKLEFETLRMLRGCDYETFCDTGVLVEPHHKAPITWKDVSFLWKVTEKTMDVESLTPKPKAKEKERETETEKEKEKNMSKEKEKDKEKEKEKDKVNKDTNGDSHAVRTSDISDSSRNGHDISMKDKNEKEKGKERETTEKREKDKGSATGSATGGAGVNNKSKDSSSNSSTNGHSPSKTKGRSRNSSHREFIMPEKPKTFSTSHNPNGHNNSNNNNNNNNNNSNISNNHNNNKNDSNHHRNHSSNENHRNGIHHNGSNNNNSNNNSNSNSSNNNKYHTNSGKLTVSIDNGSTTNINTHSSQKQRTFINSTQQILSNGSQSGTNSRQYRGFNGNQGHDNRNRNNHHNRRQTGKNWRKK